MFPEELYEHINEKVDAGELPQAKFGKNVDDTTPKTKRKGKLSRLSIHMGKKSGTSTNSGKLLYETTKNKTTKE